MRLIAGTNNNCMIDAFAMALNRLPSVIKSMLKHSSPYHYQEFYPIIMEDGGIPSYYVIAPAVTELIYKNPIKAFKDFVGVSNAVVFGYTKHGIKHAVAYQQGIFFDPLGSVSVVPPITLEESVVIFRI